MPARLLTSLPGAAAARQPPGPSSRAARAGGSAGKLGLEGVARHLAQLRRDLNNHHLPPAVRAGQLRQYRAGFYELAAACFAHQQVPRLAAYMRDQQASLRRWTQELYGVQPTPPTADRTTATGSPT